MINDKDTNFVFLIFYTLHFIFYILFFSISYYFISFHFTLYYIILELYLYYSWIIFILLGWWWELSGWWQPSRWIWCFGNRIYLYRLLLLSLKIIDFIPCKYVIFDIWFLRNFYFIFIFVFILFFCCNILFLIFSFFISVIV